MATNNWFLAGLKEASGKMAGLYGSISETGVSGPGTDVPSAVGTFFTTIKLHRIIGFTILVLVIGFIVVLLNQEVMSGAASKSRCARYRNAYSNGSVYQVSAKTTANSAPLYHIRYDLKRKTTTTGCDCTKGSILNSFATTLRDLTLQIDRPSNINCMCDTNYSSEMATKKIGYDGVPELVSYQLNGGGSAYATFFTEYVNTDTNKTALESTFDLPVPPKTPVTA